MSTECAFHAVARADTLPAVDEERAEYGLAVWSTPAWLAGAESWMDGRLAEAGIERTGEVTQPHLRAWGTALTAPTTRGPVWLKAPGPETAFEAALYELLGTVVPDRVLVPIAVDVPRGWILLPDGGPTLREHDDGSLLPALEAILPRYAQLQRDLESHVDKLVAFGVADMRAPAMPARFDEALAVARRYVTDHGTANDRTDLDRIAALRPEFVAWCAELAESPVPASLDHNDLHPGNVFAAGTRFYDWGDSVVAHPFASMLVTLAYVHSLFGPTAGPARVRDAYLEPFTDLAPRTALVAQVELACRVAKAARVLTWDRALRAQGYSAAGEFGRAPLETLLNLRAPGWHSVGSGPQP